MYIYNVHVHIYTCILSNLASCIYTNVTIFYINQPKVEFSVHIRVYCPIKLYTVSLCVVQAHQYTDVGRFSLRCLACGVALRGQTEAQNHAVVTGHINFGEV